MRSSLDSLSKTTLALAEYNKKNNSVTEEVEMSDSLSKLSNYLTEHVENDLIPALFDKATSLVQIATSRPESYTTNEEEGKHLNVGVFLVILILSVFLILSRGIRSLKDISCFFNRTIIQFFHVCSLYVISHSP